MMKVVAFVGAKGGIGKTTLSTYFAVGAALRGNKVLFIDADMQGNATDALGIAKGPGFYNLLTRHANWHDVIKQVPQDVLGGQGIVMVLPSNFETRFVGDLDGVNLKLASAIKDISPIFDICVIDTSPQAGSLHEAVLGYSDYLLMPTECEEFSVMQGLKNTINFAESIREQSKVYGLDVAQLIGIIPNKVRKRTVIHQKFLEVLRRDYGDLVFEPIPQTTAIGESQFMQQYLLTAAPDLKITKIMWQMIDRILTRVGVKNVG